MKVNQIIELLIKNPQISCKKIVLNGNNFAQADIEIWEEGQAEVFHIIAIKPLIRKTSTGRKGDGA